jgi:hypothetical protein
MTFDWLVKFHHGLQKEPGYAEKTLTAYRLGMRAKGSILGVVVQPAQDCCAAARQLPENKIYHPDEAPRLPLPDCPQGRRCGCVYRPVMTYQDSSKADHHASGVTPNDRVERCSKS